MKPILIALFLLSGGSFCLGQSEFPLHANGLIYSDTTIGKLRHIVDSLNLRYKVCPSNKISVGLPQAMAHYVVVTQSASRTPARHDIERGISFDSLVLKYPDALVQRDLCVVKRKTQEDGETTIVIETLPLLDREYRHRMYFSDSTQETAYTRVKGTWVLEEQTRYNPVGSPVRAFFFTTEFEQQPLPEKYGKMVQYADCLIDSTSQVYLEGAKYDEHGRFSFPDSFAAMSLETKREWLNRMRNTIVVGHCSHDDGPREHAKNIAMLAAETAEWEVFLRAHLDVMNDYFERMSDGNYAWGSRNTYLAELEAIDLNIPFLMMGIALRTGNPALNHYDGSISRLGRAVAESSQPVELEAVMLQAIKDSELDWFNRLIIYQLFKNQIYFIENNELKMEKLEKLKEAVSSMPVFISSRLTVNDRY